LYIPAAFNESDLSTLHDFIEQNSFGLLCSWHDGKPFASHLPFLLERGAAARGVLVGHMARANPQWRQAAGQEVLAVFSGPHAYISPAWYEADDVVPTWNYVAVHAVGTLEVVDEPEALRTIVAAMVSHYESSRPQPWQLGGPSAYLDRMLRGIVGFRIEIAVLEGKWKLGQNHPWPRREKVVRALREQGGENAQAIADLMERTGG
jgi:transcriptional regulator